MPTYEYRCQKCRMDWSISMSTDAAMNTVTSENACPKCASICKRNWDPPMLHWNWEDVSGTSQEKTKTEVHTDRHFRNKEMFEGWADLKRDGYEFGPGQEGAKARVKHIPRGGRQI